MTIETDIYFAIIVLLTILVFWLYFNSSELQKSNVNLQRDNDNWSLMVDSMYITSKGLDKLLRAQGKEIEKIKRQYNPEEKERDLALLQEQLADLQIKHNYVLAENHNNIQLAQDNARKAMYTFHVLQRVKDIDPALIKRVEDQIKRDQQRRQALNKQQARLQIVKEDDSGKEKT